MSTPGYNNTYSHCSNNDWLTDPSGHKPPKSFSFDHSYWSFDGFEEDADGVYQGVTDLYADQRRVFADLGQGLVCNAFAGYNAALFAYGQTGSGKSYSMLGYGANAGIVPITCEELFSRIAAETDGTREFQVC